MLQHADLFLSGLNLRVVLLGEEIHAVGGEPKSKRINRGVGDGNRIKKNWTGSPK